MRVLRLCTAFGAMAVLMGLAAVVALAFARLVERNVSLAHELTVVKSEVRDLQRKRAEQERLVRRLRDPAGAIPVIHDRLRMVRPNETVIYVTGPRPSPSPLP